MFGEPAKKILILPVLSCMFCVSSLSPGVPQEHDVLTVKTLLSQDGVYPGGSIKVAFLLDILPGWHINGNELADPYLIASELFIEETEELKVLEIFYPEPHTGQFGYSQAEVKFYEGEVVLGVLIQISKKSSVEEHVLEASLLYQPCDFQSCMSPQTLDLKVKFPVVPTSQKIQELNTEIFSKIKFKEENRL
jgi:hypothetical protein